MQFYCMMPSKKIKMLLAVTSMVGLASLACHEARAQNHEVEITGPVAKLSGTCPSLQFTVGNQQIVTNAGTDFDDGTCADVRNGRRIEVEGTLGTDGKLVAREVDLK